MTSSGLHLGSNIFAAWERSTEDDRAFGTQAYQTYHKAMHDFGAFYNVGVVPTTEAFVALSPNNDYHGNLRSLSAVLWAHARGKGLQGITVSTYRACGIRALSYINGSQSFLDTVRGQKIISFRHNVLYPDTSPRVTVDGHLIAIAHAKPLTMRQAAFMLKSDKEYFRLESLYRAVARRAAIRPLELQSTLWAARKREQGIKFSTQGELFTAHGEGPSGEHRWLEAPDPRYYPRSNWMNGACGFTRNQRSPPDP